jgi:predicted transcriptional regulator
MPNNPTTSISLDKETADALQARAAERGMTISELLAQFAHESAPARVDLADIDELDRRWKKIESGEATVAHADIVHWLQTWGTPAFKAWPE